MNYPSVVSPFKKIFDPAGEPLVLPALQTVRRDQKGFSPLIYPGHALRQNQTRAPGESQRALIPSFHLLRNWLHVEILL
jgi:hypothetical protein